MRVVEDLLELDWEGPLTAIADIPATLLYGAVLTFSVANGPAVIDAVRRSLEPLFGPAAERKSLLGGRRLEWTGRTVAQAEVKRGRATVRLGQRVKSKRLQEAVAALAEVPEARDLRLRANVRRFGRGKDEAPLDG
jgi:hypothetical protein